MSTNLEIIEVKPGLRFTVGALQRLLPDVETALFFGKVYELDYHQLSVLLSTVLHSDLANALFKGTHSEDLQDYLVDIVDVAGVPVTKGDITTSKKVVPQGEILPELWAQLEIEVAQSIKDVAAKLENVVGQMPGKQGRMVFKSLAMLNKRRPTIGDYKAKIHHQVQTENLVILDVSGSMTAQTIGTIVDDVVAMSYLANAHLAIVSNTCTYWAPGTYGTDDILAAAEFSGTHYETLLPLFDRDWGVVVTIADYDSSYSAQSVIATAKSTCTIDEVLDISLVNRPTFLAETVGQLAKSVRPLLIAATHNVLGSRSAW